VKVLLLPADKSGCAYYRIDEPTRAIRDAGFDIEIEIDNGLDVDAERTGDTTTLHSVDPHGADVVVFQRPTNFVFLDAMRYLQSRGVACVVEIDDLMHGVSTSHAGHKAIVEEEAADRIHACAREADLVTCTTPALAKEYARHGRVAVVPNAIPRRVAELPPAYEQDDHMVSIGWTGSVYTHPHDLQVIGTGLRTALDRTTHQSMFSILGQARGARERLGLRHVVTEVPWLPDVDEYLRTIGEIFDIGLAPLRDDRFNRSKSWLKPLEYAARGIFPVRSPIVEYDRLGIGWRAKSPKDWAAGITKAAQSTQYRREAASLARDKVLASHLTEHTAERWVAAWQQAADIRTRV
jgi:hypothetical protein